MNDHTNSPAVDALAVARLAALAPFDYDRVRRAEARGLGVRPETLDGMVQHARPAARFGAEAEPDQPPAFSDESLALRFTAQHRDRLRYVSAWGKWLLWDGTTWRFDDTKKAFDLARNICRKVSVECNDPGLAIGIACARTVAATERLAQADRQHAATVDQWDADQWLLNTPGGVVDLRTGRLAPHRADLHMTKITAAAPGGECPQWRAFLAKVTDGKVDLQLFLQRMAGYALTGSTREHAMFFCYGTGGNGKGVFLNTLTAILSGYAVVAAMETFTASSSDRHPADLAMLRGARLVTAQETEEGRQWAEARIKAMTGGDPITARFMRQDFFTYYPQFKLIIAGNHKPGLRNVDEAIRRRFNMVPFDVKIPKAEIDRDLSEKLKSEWPGILQWAIDGCMLWQERGLAPPEGVLAATDGYFKAEDSLALWIGERCKRIGYGYTETKVLYADWCQWATAAGENPGSMKQFSQSLEARDYTKTTASNGRSAYEGIALNNVQPSRTEPAHERE